MDYLQSLSLLFLLASQLMPSNAFQVIRGARDRFSNPECDEGRTQCLPTCSPYYAQCTSNACKLCICDEKSRTYVASEKRCVKDEEIFSRSVPKYSSYGISDWLMTRFIQVTSSGELINAMKYTGEGNERWMYTNMGQLMNIASLECIDANNANKIAVRPCRIDGLSESAESQNWKCARKTRGLYQMVKNKKMYLEVAGDTFYTNDVQRNRWFPNDGTRLNRSVCDTPVVYQGCYRFKDGSFVAQFSQREETNCENKTTSDCFKEMKISAPIFVGNSKCTLLWNKSMFSVNEQPWTTLSGYHNDYFTLSVFLSEQSAREIVLKMHRQAIEVWAGALLKLEIQCKGASSEQHCVLLKLDGENSQAKRRPSSAMVRNPKSRDGSNSYKASTIALSVILAILLTLVVAVFVMRRRRYMRMLSVNNDLQAQPFCKDEEHVQL